MASTSREITEPSFDDIIMNLKTMRLCNPDGSEADAQKWVIAAADELLNQAPYPKHGDKNGN